MPLLPDEDGAWEDSWVPFGCALAFALAVLALTVAAACGWLEG